MTMLSQLLDLKGHEIYSVKPDTAVIDAIRVMAEQHVGALLVLEGNRDWSASFPSATTRARWC